MKNLLLVSALIVVGAVGWARPLPVDSMAILPALLDGAAVEVTSTVDRVFHAKSLAAKTPRDFRALQHKAKIAAAVQAGTSSALVASAVVSALRLLRLDRVGPLFTALFAGLSSYSVVRTVKAIKRIRMHHRYARHAKELHALLQSDEFKESLGVKDWEKVSKVRISAEKHASAWTAGPGAGVAFVLGLLSGDDFGSACFNWFCLNSFLSMIVKPLVAKKIRSKGGAAELEKEFDAHLDDQAAHLLGEGG